MSLLPVLCWQHVEVHQIGAKLLMSSQGARGGGHGGHLETGHSVWWQFDPTAIWGEEFCMPENVKNLSEPPHRLMTGKFRADGWPLKTEGLELRFSRFFKKEHHRLPTLQLWGRS